MSAVNEDNGSPSLVDRTPARQFCDASEEDRKRVKALLIRARKRINDPEHWTQGANARDKEGRVAWRGDSSATCWCAYGAVTTETRHISNVVARMRLVGLALIALRWQGDVMIYNDTHTHEQVLAVFDEAIALAEETT